MFCNEARAAWNGLEKASDLSNHHQVTIGLLVHFCQSQGRVLTNSMVHGPLQVSGHGLFQ